MRSSPLDHDANSGSPGMIGGATDVSGRGCQPSPSSDVASMWKLTPGSSTNADDMIRQRSETSKIFEGMPSTFTMAAGVVSPRIEPKTVC